MSAETPEQNVFLLHECGEPLVSQALRNLADQFEDLEMDGAVFDFTALLIDDDDDGGVCFMAAYELHEVVEP